MRLLLTTVRKPTSTSTTPTSDISLPWNWLWCHASKMPTVHHLRLHTWLCPRFSILNRSLGIVNLLFRDWIVDRSEITISVSKMTSLRQLAVSGLVKVSASRCFILKVYIRGATTTAICCVIL